MQYEDLLYLMRLYLMDALTWWNILEVFSHPCKWDRQKSFHKLKYTQMLMFCIWNTQKNIMNIILLIDILYPLCFLPKVNFSFLIVLRLKFKFFVSPQWVTIIGIWKKIILLLINIKYNVKHLEKFQNWIMKKCYFFLQN